MLKSLRRLRRPLPFIPRRWNLLIMYVNAESEECSHEDVRRYVVRDPETLLSTALDVCLNAECGAMIRRTTKAGR
jgi:hypothetical protein